MKLDSIIAYTGLAGTVRTREDVGRVIALAKAEGQARIADRLEAALAKYPDPVFEIGAVANIVEQVPHTCLHGLECTQVDEGHDGLAKAVSPEEIYRMITERMITMIEQANSSEWKKKWSARTYGTGYTIPFNFASKKRYRGVNVMLLTGFEPLENPFFLTFKQIEDLGGHLIKGSKGHAVVYYTTLYKIEDAQRDIDFGTYDAKKAKTFAQEKGIDESMIEQIPILKYYNVFNGADILGIDFGLDKFKIGFIDVDRPATATIAAAEAITDHYPSPKPTIRHGGNRAFYSEGGNLVQMPHRSDFDTIQDYYRVLFHELGHSTGAHSRLGRKFGKSFGSKDYAFEELIAEWCATFVSAEAGILWHSDRNSAAYIKGWNAALTHIKDDHRFIMRACTEAQKAADFILQPDQDGNPLYLQFIGDYQPQEPTEVDKPKKKKKNTTKAKNNTLTVKKITPEEKTVAPEPEKPRDIPTPKPPKVRRKKDSSQLALFGDAKAKAALAMPVVDAEIVTKEKPAPGSIAERMQRPKAERTYYDIADAHIAKFLGQIERKESESVVVTITGGQGSMKTRFLFQLMNALAQKYRCGHASIEEHPESLLYENKVTQYLDAKAMNNITAPVISSPDDLERLIRANDIIFIDSFQKLRELMRGFEVDKDLRKKYDGKLFFVIFQQTSDGKMRGGSTSQFDADIVLFTEKKDDYRENFLYPDKNRYNALPTDQLKFNIFTGRMLPTAEEKQAAEPAPALNLSFKVIEK